MAIASEDLLGAITLGEHLCCICESREAGLALAVPFVKAGLERNERCVYIVDETEPRALLDALGKAGVAVNETLSAGRLVILSCHDFYLEGGRFEPQRVLDRLAHFANGAQDDGHAGMRGVGEMTWALRDCPGTERLWEYEAKLNHLLPRIPGAALCLYNRQRFAENMLLNVVRTHPLVMLHEEPLENIQYVPPEEYLEEATAQEMLERALGRIEMAPEASRRDRRILGVSAQIRGVLALVDRVAATDSSVLITGETGTGKELVAQAIHDRSPRRYRPFVKVNCAAVPQGLLEVELFGHERGAFTDALQRRPGRFELADTGTLMLDEIGEMSPEMQVKLLRVLQEREFERVGGTKPLKVDIRLLALTNQDLLAPGRQSPFRSDLYYRLNVIQIEIPPLRDRPEDIPVLAKAFLDRACQLVPRRIEGIEADALDVLLRYNWPGNVRELENAIERAVVLTDGRRLSREDVSFLGPNGTTLAPVSLADMEARHIGAVLQITGGNRTKAAEILGIHRDTLYRKLRQYDIGMP